MAIMVYPTDALSISESAPTRYSVGAVRRTEEIPMKAKNLCLMSVFLEKQTIW